MTNTFWFGIYLIIGFLIIFPRLWSNHGQEELEKKMGEIFEEDRMIEDNQVTEKTILSFVVLILLLFWPAIIVDSIIDNVK